MDKVRIYIVAGPNHGKTTIAAIIQEALREKGFTDIRLTDLPQSSDNKEPITKRFEAVKLRPIEIQVALEEAKLCGQCKERPVAYPGARFCGASCSQLSEMST